MRYFIRDHTIDITCSTGELYTMHERGMAIYSMLPPTGTDPRVMRPYIAKRPCYYYAPVLATWEDFTLPEVDGTGYVTITVARDSLHPRGPRVIGADRDGQCSLGFRVDDAKRHR
jgi:hypothetical protein